MTLPDMTLAAARAAGVRTGVVGDDRGGVSINGRYLSDRVAARSLAEVGARLDLPAADPFHHGAGWLADALAAL